MLEAEARANADVALVQHWGKRDEVLNLPYTPSVSVVLDGLSSTARVARRAPGQRDHIALNGRAAEGVAAGRIGAYLDLLRRNAGRHGGLDVDIHTSFPAAPGLGWSASVFAALALAGSTVLGLELSPRQLSILARRGSGAAARSVLGGFVEWTAGELSDGSDSHAEPLAPADHWPLGVAIAVIEAQPPAGAGLSDSVKQSPYFPAWLELHDGDLEAVRAAVLARDLAALGEAVEHHALKLHAVALAARPPLLYWRPATLAVIERVRALRRAGIEAYFTVDAGPHVKVLSHLAQRDAVAAALRDVPAVSEVLCAQPGGGAERVRSA